MDIHADMRRSHITTEFVFKTGLKTANVYRSMMEDQGIDLKYVLEEIPLTSIEYDPDDYSPFSWGDD
jgi:TATA-box binding protein (TBP) (component of TFIID and TFIIIB)